MPVIRCDYCAARLEPTQETCHKCGARNSDYKLSQPRRRLPAGRFLLACLIVVVLLAAAALKLVDLGVIAGTQLYALREKAFMPATMVKDTTAAYLAAWKTRDVRAMRRWTSPDAKTGVSMEGTTPYLIDLRAYKIGKAEVIRDKALVAVSLTTGSLSDAVKALATATGGSAENLDQAAVSALKGAADERSTVVISLVRVDGRWSIADGVSPVADEFLQPVAQAVFANGEEPAGLSDGWEAHVRVPPVTAAQVESLGVLRLTGTVENSSSTALGPLQVVATYYDAENVEIGKSVLRFASLPPQSIQPFQCFYTELGQVSVRRYSVDVSKLY